MELQKTAQRILFKELERAEIQVQHRAEYNGYNQDKFGYFQEDLNTLYENFKLELQDNLLTRSNSLVVYLTDIQKSIAAILKNHMQKQREEIYDVMKESREIFRENDLGYMNYFFNYQKEIIYKAYNEIEQKLSIVNDSTIFTTETKETSGTFISGTVDETPELTSKLKSNLSRKDLTVLWWLLSECDFIEFNSQKHLAQFLENNFVYKDTDKENSQYREMTSIQSLLSQLKNEAAVDPEPSHIMLASKLRDGFDDFQRDIIDVFEKQELPTAK